MANGINPYALQQATGAGPFTNQMANQPIPAFPPPRQAPAPRQGMGGRMMGILGSIGNFIQDNPALMNRLAIGFQGMTLNPNAAIINANQRQLEAQQQLDLLRGQANKTAEYLRRMGYTKEADIVEKNPAMAQDVFKAVIGKTIGTLGIKTSQVYTDPSSGQQYVVETNPNTAQVARRDVEGAIGLTPQQEQEMETQTALTLADREAAQAAGQRYYGQAESLNAQMTNLRSAYIASRSGGRSGIINNLLPAFDAATSRLRQAANALGIDVINSATFGALSKSELDLALSTAIDTSLGPEQLQLEIERKLRAQEKLYNQLLESAKLLSSGNTGYSTFIQQQKLIPITPPAGVPLSDWYEMDADQKRQAMELFGGNQ